MEMTNNPSEGTGLSFAEATQNIENYLDSEDGTIQEVDADEGSIEEPNTEAEIESDETEQSIEDSEEIEGEDVDSDGEQDTEEPEAGSLSDDTTVEVQGENVTLRELKDGYMRRANFTQKTQELKQHMARYQVQQIDMAQMREAVTNDVNEMRKRVYLAIGDNIHPPSPELYDADPYEYGRQKIAYEQKATALQELHTLEKMKADQDAKWQAEQFKIKQAEALEDFATKHVEFADQQKAPALLGEIGVFLSDNGFSRDEINGIADSRIMDMVYRLMKAETIAKQTPKVVKELEKLPKLAMPGTVKSTPSVNSDFHKEAQRYKRSGNFNDAVSAISKLL